MANVKVFEDKQTDPRTNGQAKNLYAPNLSMQGHKKDLHRKIDKQQNFDIEQNIRTSENQ